MVNGADGMIAQAAHVCTAEKMQMDSVEPLRATRACACQAPTQLPLAVELWFYTNTAHVRAKIQQSLAENAVVAELEGKFVKVPAAAAQLQLVNLASERLSPVEAGQVKVAWPVEGNDPLDALMEAQALPALALKLQNGWFTRLIDENGLYMVFQPIVSLQAQEVFAHEALVRGTRDGVEVAGGEIIALAQATNLLVPLDARTRTAAIQQFSASGLPGKLFINFQPSAIYDPQFCLRTTFAAAERSGMRAEDIIFEVVESEGVLDTDHLKKIVETYRARGLGVAMDDMGSGHSSLERLLSLQPDYVKIDKSITMNVVENSTARMMVESLVRISLDAGAKIIAEGIETVEQRDVLRDLGAHYGQGYLFARPSRTPIVTWPK